MQSIVFPSDFPEFRSLPERGVLAGRVVARSAQSVTIADACAELVLTHDGLPFDLGTLLVLEFQKKDDELTAQRVVDTPGPGRLLQDGEFSRLKFGRGALLRSRSRAAKVIRAYFEAEDFMEVSTPTFVPSPGLDPHVHSLAEVRRGNRVDHLITSPEFHMKRLLVGGLPRIYQFARCFRAEELGAVHEPEFTLLEWYRAFAGYESMLQDTEEIVCRVLAALDPQTPLPARPFRRLSVRAAFDKFAKRHDPDALVRRDPSDYYQVFVDSIEPAIASLPGPTFVTHFPLPLAALARQSDEDPTVAERFELYFRGVELCNGYGELTDASEQRSRHEAERRRRDVAGDPNYPIDEKFIGALDEGMPPSAGNALGFDRLVALASGIDAIGPTYAFQDSER